MLSAYSFDPETTLSIFSKVCSLLGLILQGEANKITLFNLKFFLSSIGIQTSSVHQDKL